MTEPSPIWNTNAPDAPDAPRLTAEHVQALELASAHYGFWHSADWPPDRIRRLLREVREHLDNTADMV